MAETRLTMVIKILNCGFNKIKVTFSLFCTIFSDIAIILNYWLKLKVLQSDKLSGDGQTFQVWPYLNSLIIIKLPFFQQEHVHILLLSCQVCASLRFCIRVRPEKYFLLSMWCRELYRPIIRSSIFCYLLDINI